MRTLANAERELADGNLWRAREILQGSIPNAGYDCDLFEKLGTVFLTMGDLPEAGRYLFLSGRREPAYEKAIAIFIQRHRKNAPAAFLGALPRAGRLSALAEYPDNVRSELTSLGFPEILRDECTMSRRTPEGGSKESILLLLIFGAIVGLLVLGVIKIFEIWFWFTRS